MTSRERHREAPLALQLSDSIGEKVPLPNVAAALTNVQLSVLCTSDSSTLCSAVRFSALPVRFLRLEKPLLPRSSLSKATLSHRAQFTGDLWSVTNLGHFWTRLSCHIGRFSLHKNLVGGMCCNHLLNIWKNLVFFF